MNPSPLFAIPDTLQPLRTCLDWPRGPLHERVELGHKGFLFLSAGGELPTLRYQMRAVDFGSDVVT